MILNWFHLAVKKKKIKIANKINAKLNKNDNSKLAIFHSCVHKTLRALRDQFGTHEIIYKKDEVVLKHAKKLRDQKVQFSFVAFERRELHFFGLTNQEALERQEVEWSQILEEKNTS